MKKVFPHTSDAARGYLFRPTFDSGPYSHRLAPAADINGGAEEFVFETPFENPVYLFNGPGRLAGQLLPFGNGAPKISLHPLYTKQGIPIITGNPEQQESNSIDNEGVIVSG